MLNMVEPEIDEHFLKLTGAGNCPQQSCLDCLLLEVSLLLLQSHPRCQTWITPQIPSVEHLHCR